MNLAFALAIILGILLSDLLAWDLYRQFSRGKLVAREGRFFSGRRENPVLFWSSMLLQIFVTVTPFILGIAGARR